jgi:hypothetical protein
MEVAPNHARSAKHPNCCTLREIAFSGCSSRSGPAERTLHSQAFSRAAGFALTRRCSTRQKTFCELSLRLHRSRQDVELTTTWRHLVMQLEIPGRACFLCVCWPAASHYTTLNIDTICAHQILQSLSMFFTIVANTHRAPGAACVARGCREIAAWLPDPNSWQCRCQ